MIRIEKLGFSYGQVPVLKNITMNLEPGKIYGLLGENGVGKTTLLTLFAGLKKPLQGSIDIDGSAPYSRTPQVLENQFYLADEMLPVPMKAAEYARITGEFWPNYKQDTFEEIMELFENTSDKKMSEMSTGQLKKTYISLALALGCKYLFLDEPTNGLDIPSKAQFRSALMKYTGEDSTIVISTHQVRDLENIMTRSSFLTDRMSCSMPVSRRFPANFISTTARSSIRNRFTVSSFRAASSRSIRMRKALTAR